MIIRCSKSQKTRKGEKHFNGPKAFIKYSSDMHDIYENIEEYNPDNKRKILNVFDNIVADKLANKKLNPIIKDLFIRGTKLNISLFIKLILFVFII